MAEIGQSQQTYMDPIKRELLNFLTQQSMGLISGMQPKLDEQGNIIYGTRQDSLGNPLPEMEYVGRPFSQDAVTKQVAPLTGLETSAYQAAGAGVGQFLPYLQDARRLYGESGALERERIPFVTEGILGTRKGMDLVESALPYYQGIADENRFTEQVADRLTQRLEDNEARQLSNLARNAGGSGALGGSRYGIERANIQEGTQEALADSLANLYNTNFQNQRQAEQVAAQGISSLGSTYGNMASAVPSVAQGYGSVATGLGSLAGNFAQLGQTGQQMYGQDLNTARTYGQSLRDYNQSLLDTRQSNLYAEQSLPFQLLGYMSGVTGSLPNNNYTISTPLPNQGDSYGMASGIAGVGPFGGGSV